MNTPAYDTAIFLANVKARVVKCPIKHHKHVIRAYYATELSRCDYFTDHQKELLKSLPLKPIPLSIEGKAPQLYRSRLCWISKYNYPSLVEIENMKHSQIFRSIKTFKAWLEERTIPKSLKKRPLEPRRDGVAADDIRESVKSLLNSSIKACDTNQSKLFSLRDAIDDFVASEHNRRTRLRTTYRHLF